MQTRETAVPGERYTLLVCNPPEFALPVDTLTEAFPEHGYRVLAVTSERAADALSIHQPDAILAPNAPDIARLFRSIELRSDRAPVRVLLPTTDEPISEASPADAVLTQDRASWGSQLLPLLRMRAQIMALREENARLRGKKGSRARASKGDVDLELFKRYIFNNVTHELRTPLLQMKAALAMLAQDPTNATLIDLAIKATARLEENVQNILQIAQSSNITLDAAFIDDAVEIALRSLRNSWRHSTKLDRVIIEIEPNLPPVLADKRAIGIALTHLIENGLKFSEHEVKVRAALVDHAVEVSVEDRGIGIRADMQPIIFGEFIQGDPTSTRRYDGMGIGLAIVRTILEAHHTTIHVQSSPNKGARFSFLLNIVPLDPPVS